MLRKFKKKELIERLGMTEEKVKLVIEAQNKFPEVLVNDSEGFVLMEENFIKS